MHSTGSEILLHKPSCGPCRPIHAAFKPSKGRQNPWKAPLQTASLAQRARTCRGTASTRRPACSQPVLHLAVDSSNASTSLNTPNASYPSYLPALAAVIGFALLVLAIKKVFDTPSRTYKENVGQEYDSWTDDGVLEYYWGEHIHLGYYTEEERRQGYKSKNFKQAKLDFVDQMLRWSGAKNPSSVLDVGCGIGGTTRILAKNFPNADVKGITLSQSQVRRGTELAAEQGLNKCSFQVMNALQMDFPDNSFDLVWACESGEHMPDKKAYIEEMTRVLKPGGTLVIACWCQREETPSTPLSKDEKDRLQFLYDEWAHPYFISNLHFGRLMEGTGQLEAVDVEDWTQPTIDSWRHSIWVGVWDPWIVIFKGPIIWYRTMREIVTLERMHRAFDKGLMQYGMMKAVKKQSEQQASHQSAASSVRSA